MGNGLVATLLFKKKCCYFSVVNPTILSIHPSQPFFFSSSSTVMVPTGYTGRVVTCLGTSQNTVTLQADWLRGELIIPSDFRIIPNTHLTVAATLEFRNGFNIAVAGYYTCTVHAEGTASSQSRTVRLEQGARELTTEQVKCQDATAYFQIRVLNITTCSTWDSNKKRLIEANFLTVLTGVIASICDDCSLGFGDIEIQNSTACSEFLEGAAVLRGMITTSEAARVDTLFCALYRWQQSAPAVFLTDTAGTLHHVDQKCTLRLSSPTDGECAGPDQGLLTLSALLAFSIAGVVFLVTVIIAGIVAIIRSVLRKRYIKQSSDPSI